jgi:hypothetical protein
MVPGLSAFSSPGERQGGIFQTSANHFPFGGRVDELGLAGLSLEVRQLSRGAGRAPRSSPLGDGFELREPLVEVLPTTPSK